MRILITNDDGVYSPGIAALAQAAAEFGEVRVVAPDVEMSSAGHSISSSRPLTVKKTPIAGLDAWRVNGTPADCVGLGVFTWDNKVDLVLSGINLGPNLGNAMWHSGTLAGAKQAALLGLRGIAFSIPTPEGKHPDFEMLKPWVTSVLELLIGLEELRLVNVNLPVGKPKGIRWTCQSVRHYDGKVVAAKDPAGRPIYWYTVVPIEGAEEASDLYAVQHGLVSMTPLRLDLTDHEQLQRAKSLEQIRFA
ncbi:MAG: 5'/3'-nucleotidase SurE [Betaproteobacteria bacterium]